MGNFKQFKQSDFEYVGNKYQDKHLLSRTKLHKRGKKLRVYYYLPNGNWAYFNSVPELKSKREKEELIAEFRYLLSQGFLPRSSAEIIRTFETSPTDGNFAVYTEKYFGIYAINENAKLKHSEKTIRCIIKRCLDYFMKEKGYTSINQITDQDIKDWDESLEYTKKIRGKGLIGPGTRYVWRKTLRAFLSMAKRHKYALQCDPEEMNIYEWEKGEIDKSAGVRGVIFPDELIESILICNYSSTKKFSADIRKIPQFLKDTGIRPAEFFTQSDYNIEWKKNRPVSIKVKELKQCPHKNEIGFEPKTFYSYRTIELTDFCVDFILETIENLKGAKRYGKINNELVEFPFLFAFYSEKDKAYVRHDLTFHNEFRDLIDHAIVQFNLPYQVSINGLCQYDLIDIRRSCNYWLKMTLGYSDYEAADFLGHSVWTNRKHYTLKEDKTAIRERRTRRSLDEVIKTNSHVY